MTVRSRVAGVVERIKPGAICDSCLAEALDLSERDWANRANRHLWASSDSVAAKGTATGARRVVT